MTSQVKCQFCGKETVVPDNMTDSVLRCPYCIRDFDVCQQAITAGSGGQEDTASPDLSRQAASALQNAVNVIISNRQKNLRNQNLFFAVAVLIAAPSAWLLHPKEDLLTLAIFFFACLLIGGLFLFFIASRFSQTTSQILLDLNSESAIKSLPRQQLYRVMLASLAKSLQTGEPEIVSDPLLRQVLRQIEDSADSASTAEKAK